MARNMTETTDWTGKENMLTGNPQYDHSPMSNPLGTSGMPTEADHANLGWGSWENQTANPAGPQK